MASSQIPGFGSLIKTPPVAISTGGDKTLGAHAQHQAHVNHLAHVNHMKQVAAKTAKQNAAAKKATKGKGLAY